MFDLSITPEFLAYLLAGLVAILFDWFPKLSEWFDALGALKKQQFMGLLLALIVVVIFGGACLKVFVTGFACDQAGFAQVAQVWLIAVGVNQGVHLLTKPTQARKELKKYTGQGMVEYALILVLVAVVVIAALAIMGPLVTNVFSSINASL